MWRFKRKRQGLNEWAGKRWSKDPVEGWNQCPACEKWWEPGRGGCAHPGVVFGLGKAPDRPPRKPEPLPKPSVRTVYRDSN